MAYDTGQFNKLMDEHLKLTKKFEELKELARINLDLLVLSVDLENFPEVKGDLDNIRRLVHALMVEREVTTNVRSVRKSQRQARRSGNGKSVSVSARSKNKAFPIGPISTANGDDAITNTTNEFLLPIHKGQISATTTANTTLKDSQHLKSHFQQEVFNYACGVCGKEFRMKKSLALHRRTHEKKQKNNRVQNGAENKTAQQFKCKDANSHDELQEKVLGGQKFKCSMCSEEFGFDWEYDEHLKLHPHQSESKRSSGSHDKKTKQDIAEGEVSSLDSEVLHGKNEGADIMNSSSEEMKKTNELHKCDACDKQFETKALLKRHCRVHDEDLNCPKKKQSIQICSVCGKQCKSKIAMLSHLRIHKTVNEVHKCAECGKEFLHKWRYNRHLHLHASQNSFVCDYCGKTFKTISNLRCHIALIHVKKYQQECNVCGKTFARVSNLTRHLRTHCGEKLHKCLICPKVFSRADNCRLHEKKHDGLYSHPCQLCGKGFDFPSQLRYHQKHFHAELTLCSCSACGKTFSSIAEAQSDEHCESPGGIHKLGCCEENRYRCALCTARFDQKVPFALHLLSEHIKNLDKCLVCDNDKVFHSAEELKCHLNNVHLKVKGNKRSMLFNPKAKSKEDRDSEQSQASVD